MQVAVTGGTGCLGQPLVKELTKKGHSVKLLRLPSDPQRAIQHRNVSYIQGTITDKGALRKLLSGCEVVFHLAAKVHEVTKRNVDESEYYNVNVEGAKLILETAKEENVSQIIFYSTVGVYGPDADFHGDENSPCYPKTPYSRSKYLAEQLVLNSSNSGGPEGVVLRFPVVYGPLDRGNIARLIKAIYHKYFFYFGAGNCLRSMISSTNVAESAIKAAFEPQAVNELFCVTDGQDYTLQEVVEAICHALNTSWRPFHIPLSVAEWAGRLGDLLEKSARIPFPINSAKVMKLSRSLTFSCEKAKRVFGYEPIETLTEGIFREVEWLKTINRWK